VLEKAYACAPHGACDVSRDPATKVFALRAVLCMYVDVEVAYCMVHCADVPQPWSDAIVSKQPLQVAAGEQRSACHFARERKAHFHGRKRSGFHLVFERSRFPHLPNDAHLCTGESGRLTTRWHARTQAFPYSK
jgi:hypothetical protein